MSEDKARLIREAQAAAALNHPHICTVYGIHEEDGRTFIAMAYIDGESWRIRSDAPACPRTKHSISPSQMAQGLQEAHEQGIVHRDIKRRT